VWAAGYGYVWAKCRLQMIGLDWVGIGQKEWHFVGFQQLWQYVLTGNQCVGKGGQGFRSVWV